MLDEMFGAASRYNSGIFLTIGAPETCGSLRDTHTPAMRILQSKMRLFERPRALLHKDRSGLTCPRAGI